MTGRRTYLDYNATAPLRSEAREAMLAAMSLTGNPSSVHAEGRRARAIVEEARNEVAALAGARPDEVVFTSGATEALNWVTRGGWSRILAARLEHPAVLEPSRRDDLLREIAVSKEGAIDLPSLAAALDASAEQPLPTLVFAQLANNETGITQDVAAVAALARAKGAVTATDAVQAAGRIALDFASLGADLMVLSSHKIGGPKGVGALIARDGRFPPALISGGGQERRRRAGTENVEAIAGFGAAAHEARREATGTSHMRALRDNLEEQIRHLRPDAVIVGAASPRIPNTMAIGVPGTTAETVAIKLDLAGVAVSAGAACSSGKVGVSSVLAAMGLPVEIARAVIRVSLGHGTSETDIAAFIAAWSDAVTKARPGGRVHAHDTAASRVAAPGE
ncbi:MAG: cysteine desulfurase family protein [Hyphomicrobiaceae bacterium]